MSKRKKTIILFCSLTFGGVSDRALGDIAEGLMSNTSVQELRYVSNYGNIQGPC